MNKHHCCHPPKPKTYFKKVIKKHVTKIKYVPKVKKWSEVEIVCGVIKKHKRRSY